MVDVRAYACTWGGVSIDFGGGALHYFHRFISRETRRGKEGEGERRKRKDRGGTRGAGDTSFGLHSTDVDVDVDVEGEREGRLVSFRYTKLTLVSRAQLRGRGRFPAYKDALQMQWWLIRGLYLNALRSRCSRCFPIVKFCSSLLFRRKRLHAIRFESLEFASECLSHIFFIFSIERSFVNHRVLEFERRYRESICES